MKRIAIFLLLASTTACASQKQMDAFGRLERAIADAHDPAGPGGSDVTQDEEADIQAHWAEVRGAEGFDWTEVGAGLLASLAVIFPALRWLPNGLFLGRAEGAALKKLANGNPVTS